MIALFDDEEDDNVAMVVIVTTRHDQPLACWTTAVFLLTPVLKSGTPLSDLVATDWRYQKAMVMNNRCRQI